MTTIKYNVEITRDQAKKHAKNIIQGRNEE